MFVILFITPRDRYSTFSAKPNRLTPFYVLRFDRNDFDETRIKRTAAVGMYSRKPLELILASESMKLHSGVNGDTISVVSLISFKNDLAAFR